MKTETTKNKLKQTIIKTYGVDHISKLERIKQQKKEKSLKKYGLEYSLQSPIVREKSKKTNLKKYGVENPQQNKEIREKVIKTNLEKYGVEHYSQTNEFKEKVTKTNLEKYGVPHHSQNPEIAEKMANNAYKRKKYKMPSGKIIYLQGYENFMMDYLLFNENIKENDIFTRRIDVPRLWFIDNFNIKHYHYVDFYIKSQNRCIEVKSNWTNQDKNFVFEKQVGAKDLGYIYEVWILDRKGNILNTFK